MNITSLHARALRLKNYVIAHKILSAIIAVVVVFGGYWMYGKFNPTIVQTHYVLTTVQQGTIISIVSGSGQVSPSNQVTINPKSSGTITRILVKNGQSVAVGQPLAYIDATTQLQTIANAKLSLQSAQLSLQKLQQPATQLSVTQSQDAIARAQESEVSAQTDLANTYQSSYNDIVSTFLDLPNIQSDLQDTDIGTAASKGSLWNIDYYKSATVNWDNNAFTYRDNTYNDYMTALSSYNAALADYQKTDQGSATSTIAAMLTETYTTTQAESKALNTANSFVRFYENLVKNHNQNPIGQADTSLTLLNTDITKINSHLTTLLGDTNQISSDLQSIADAQRTIVEDQQSYTQLQAGTTNLDLQSSQLSVQQQQNALQQAEDNLANYTISAPFAGTLANFTLTAGDTVSSGTNVATLITAQDIADLSLNEVDAAKIVAGQQVTITFDAIPNLSLTGQVADVSPLGTVSQGVVSYDVKIAFSAQDARIKAGMTANADIQAAVHSSVLEVPASAIQTISGATYVQAFVPAIQSAGATSSAGITSLTAPQSILVTIGISDNTNTEIVSGLTLGQQIVKSSTASASSKSAAASATSRSSFGGPGGGGGAAIRL